MHAAPMGLLGTFRPSCCPGGIKYASVTVRVDAHLWKIAGYFHDRLEGDNPFSRLGTDAKTGQVWMLLPDRFKSGQSLFVGDQ